MSSNSAQYKYNYQDRHYQNKHHHCNDHNLPIIQEATSSMSDQQLTDRGQLQTKRSYSEKTYLNNNINNSNNNQQQKIVLSDNNSMNENHRTIQKTSKKHNNNNNYQLNNNNNKSKHNNSIENILDFVENDSYIINPKIINHNNNTNSKQSLQFNRTSSSNQQQQMMMRFNSSLKCHDCLLFSLKIQQLTSTYEQLLLCKTDQIHQYREIIERLQTKIKKIEERSKKEIQKNKLFRAQLEKVQVTQKNGKQKEQSVIEYLKLRQLNLLDQLKELQNKSYLKQLQYSTILQGQSRISDENSKTIHQSHENRYSRTNSSKIDLKQTLIKSYMAASTGSLTHPQPYNLKLDELNPSHFYSLSNQDYMSSKMNVNQLIQKSNENICLKDNLMVSQILNRIIKLDNWKLNGSEDGCEDLNCHSAVRQEAS